MEKCTANEIRWIVRIILKGEIHKQLIQRSKFRTSHPLPDLGIGIKENTVFSVFHPDAIDLFNTCSDLKKVAWDLADPNYRLHEEVGRRTSKPINRMEILILF